MDSQDVPRSRRRLVAVFDDERAADDARRRLVASGVPAGAITIGARDDEVTSLRGEMREEVTKGWILPQASFIATKEGARGFVVTLVIATLVGLALGVPLALIDFGFSFGIRLLIVEGIVLVMAFAIALVVGPGMATARPDVPMAAERGVTLSVDSDATAVRDALIAMGPIRVDEVTDDGAPIDTVMTEADQGQHTSVAEELGRATRDLADNVHGDDYHDPNRNDPNRRGNEASRRS